MYSSIFFLLAPLLATGVIAHDLTEDQKQHMTRSRPLLQHCQAHFLEEDHKSVTAKRHIDNLKRAKEHHGLGHVPVPIKAHYDVHQAHSPNDVLRVSHQVFQEWDELSLTQTFGDSNVCALTPEGDIGPLYVGNQHIRSDLRDGQIGVPLHLEIQVIDQKTCQPVSDAYIDFWACNSTGVYSGVLDFPGNGNPRDRSLIKKEHGRGIQPTDLDGIAHFIVNVPGHYVGRSTHMHVGVHHDVNVFRNGTIKGGRVSHIGQLYMDQAILHAVENIHPYNTNTGPWTQNSEDAHFLEAATGGDPVLKYSLLGRDVAQGMYGWIRLAVDMDAHRRMPGYTEEKVKREVLDIPGEGQVEAEDEIASKDTSKKPLALPLPQALPKMYMYGSSFMPQDLNAQPEEEQQAIENKRIHQDAMEILQDNKTKATKSQGKSKDPVSENHLEIQHGPEAK